MLRLRVDRKWKKDTYTIGRLYVNDELWCNTLEDKDRGLKSTMPTEEIKKIKVYGETAIPTGKYQITYTYSPKFRRYLPLVNDVRCFTSIRIHQGNTAKDSSGCILVGSNTAVGKLTSSTIWLRKLCDRIRDAINHGEIVTLEII